MSPAWSVVLSLYGNCHFYCSKSKRDKRRAKQNQLLDEDSEEDLQQQVPKTLNICGIRVSDFCR